MKLDRRDALVAVGILLLAIGGGAYDWRMGAALTGVLLLGIGLFYKG